MQVIVAVTGLLLVTFFRCGSTSKETRYVALSDDLTICNLTCDADGEYVLDHVFDSVILTYYCTDQTPEIYGKYKERVVVDKTRGCVCVKNLQYGDAGDYALWFMDKKRNKRFVRAVYCELKARVTITNITYSSGDLVENTSLSVLFSGDDPVTVFWSKDGGDLPQVHRLSNHNRTLSIPKNATGLYKVTVTNIVGADSMTYTISPRGHQENFRLWWPILVPVLLVAALVSVLIIYKLKKKHCKSQDAVI